MSKLLQMHISLWGLLVLAGLSLLLGCLFTLLCTELRKNRERDHDA